MEPGHVFVEGLYQKSRHCLADGSHITATITASKICVHAFCINIFFYLVAAPIQYEISQMAKLSPLKHDTNSNVWQFNNKSR